MHDKRQQLHKIWMCWLTGGGTVTGGGTSMRGKGAVDGRLWDNQPNKRGLTRGRAGRQGAMGQPAQ